MFSSVNTCWTLVAAFLVYFMQAGFALCEAGFTRAKNTGNILMKNMMDFCIGTPCYWIIGFGLMFGGTGALIGGFDPFIQGDYSHLGLDIPLWVYIVFQTVFCATAATIVSGSMAERTNFKAYCVYSAAISLVVYPICGHWMWGGGWLQSMGFHDFAGSAAVHNVGGVIALVGIVVLPITSGDTAYRSARLTIADWFHIDQAKVGPRAALSVPLLAVGAVIALALPWDVLWRYFSWANQTLAMIVLWAASMYLFKEKKNFWITAVPATFMSAVSSTYFVLAPECLGGLLNSKTAEGATIYNTAVAYPVGVLFAVAMLAIFIHATKKSAAKA